jgi:hypothetical protein
MAADVERRERWQRRALVLLAPVLFACTPEPPPEDPCAEVTCSDHGVCVETDAGAECACEAGYVAAGLYCIAPTPEPAVVAFTVEPAELSQGQDVHFTLVVSGPLDEPDPVDAELRTAAGVPMAALVPTGIPWTYRTTLSWAQLNALEEISFLDSLDRTFVAHVSTPEGFSDSIPATVTFTCGGTGACRGECRAEMTLKEPQEASAAECAAWSCSDKKSYPLACLSNGLFHLWVSDSEWKALHEDVHADVEVDGFYFFLGECGQVGIEIHGGLARKFDKKSFKVKFNRDDRFPLDPFAEAQPVPPDPVGLKQVILKAHWIDASLVRDRLTHDLLRTLGGLAPRVTHVNLLINGKYRGLYALTESVTRDFFERMSLEGEGNLYKAVNHNANFKDKADPLSGYEKKMNEEGESDDLEELLEAITKAPSDFAAFDADVGQRMDLDLYLAYTLVNAFTNNQDAFTKNYYLYHELAGDGSPFLIVNWDADATWGVSWDGAPEPADTGSPWGKTNALSARLAGIPEYREQYEGELADALDGSLSEEALAALAEAGLEAVEPDIRFEECRWDKPSSFAAQRPVIESFATARPPFFRELLGVP